MMHQLTLKPGRPGVTVACFEEADQNCDCNAGWETRTLGDWIIQICKGCDEVFLPGDFASSRSANPPTSEASTGQGEYSVVADLALNDRPVELTEVASQGERSVAGELDPSQGAFPNERLGR